MECLRNTMRPLGILVLILATSRIEGIYECCPEDNILSLVTRSCSTNDSISLECNGSRFPVNESRLEDFNYLFTENRTLIASDTNSVIRYCQSHTDKDSVDKSSDIYIICYEPVETFEANKIKVGAILGCISVVFTILTIVVYAMVPKLLDLQGICIFHALIGLAAGYIFLGIIQLSELDDNTCTSMAFLTYFCFMYLFFWLNALSFHIWRTTVYPGFLSSKKWSIVYHIFAIGGTMIFLILLLVAHHSSSEFWEFVRPGFGLTYCWFQSMRETTIFFYGPIACLLVLNVVFYLWTIIVLWRNEENTQKKIFKSRLKLCVKLLVIMGITWIFEIITAALRDPNMSLFGNIIIFLLDLFNILQGLLIFLVLVVFRKKVRRALASKNLCNIQFPNSWRYLEDDEMESFEERANCTVAEYKNNKDIDKQEPKKN